MIKFDFDIRWLSGQLDGGELDPRLLRMLKAIRDHGSLKQAAEVNQVSYRFAWELFRNWEKQLAMPLAQFERGRGARLTALGEKLLWAEQLLSDRLRPEMNSLALELNRELATVMQPGVVGKKIRFHASHDLAIVQLEELCQQSTVFSMDFQTRGSLDSLRQLGMGQCEIAGFHFPRGELAVALQTQYREWLDHRKIRLLQLASRQQGLMTQAGNPKHVKTLADLSRRSLRFINRQKQSGTRIIFDALLRHHGLDKKRIRGYLEEEFTHVAVAAMLASGAADVGFGIKAAASKFGLHFIPQIEENYVLAVAASVDDEIFKELKRLLRSEAFQNKIRKLPGYRTVNMGKSISMDKLLEGK